MSLDLSTHSNDTDVEIVMITEQILPNKQKRLKLLDFLVYSPPPEPLHWVTFHEYVVKRFKSYFPEKVMKDVFQLIDRTITKKRSVSAVIDLDSDDEASTAHARSNDRGRENRNPSCQVVPKPMSINDSCNENGDDIFSNTPLDSSFSKEELEGFKRDPTVKYYSRLLKEIYSLLKDIKDSTSCTVCTKLRYRVVRFQQAVSDESDLLRKAAQPEQETAGASSSELKERIASPVRRKSSSFKRLEKKFLTAKDVEKIREAILKDKLIELSYPDVLTSAENTQGQSNTPSDVGKKTSRPRTAKSSKKAHISEPVPPDSTGAATPSKKRGNPESVPLDSTETAKRRKNRRNSVQIAPDSTGAATPSKKRGNSETVPLDSTETAKRSKKRRNYAQVAPDSTEDAIDSDGHENVSDVPSAPARTMVKKSTLHFPQEKHNKPDDTDQEEWQPEGMVKKKKKNKRSAN